MSYRSKHFCDGVANVIWQHINFDIHLMVALCDLRMASCRHVKVVRIERHCSAHVCSTSCCDSSISSFNQPTAVSRQIRRKDQKLSGRSRMIGNGRVASAYEEAPATRQRQRQRRVMRCRPLHTSLSSTPSSSTSLSFPTSSLEFVLSHADALALRFHEIDKITQRRSARLLKAFQKHKVRSDSES